MWWITGHLTGRLAATLSVSECKSYLGSSEGWQAATELLGRLCPPQQTVCKSPWSVTEVLNGSLCSGCCWRCRSPSENTCSLCVAELSPCGWMGNGKWTFLGKGPRPEWVLKTQQFAGLALLTLYTVEGTSKDIFSCCIYQFCACCWLYFHSYTVNI